MVKTEKCITDLKTSNSPASKTTYQGEIYSFWAVFSSFVW